ncbi:unnamed protein product, partial [Heterotrigona itama]
LLSYVVEYVDRFDERTFVPPLLIMMTKDGYAIIKSPLDQENKLGPAIAQ